MVTWFLLQLFSVPGLLAGDGGGPGLFLGRVLLVGGGHQIAAPGDQPGDHEDGGRDGDDAASALDGPFLAAGLLELARRVAAGAVLVLGGSHVRSRVQRNACAGHARDAGGTGSMGEAALGAGRGGVRSGPGGL